MHSNLYIEWAERVNYRRGQMIPLDMLPNVLKQHDPGFRSIYEFLEKDALKIKAKGKSVGLNKFIVSSNKLVLDLDDGIKQLNKIEEQLKKHGFGYLVESSGGKGFHVTLDHPRVTDINLPNSHKSFVIDHGLDCDYSLYQHGRLLALKGRIHPKTKNRKKFFKIVKGSIIPEIPIVEPKKVEMNFNFTSELGMEALQQGLMRSCGLLEHEPKQGYRHTNLWGTAKDLIKGGLDPRAVILLLQTINRKWENPKDDSEIITAVELAIKQANGQ